MISEIQSRARRRLLRGVGRAGLLTLLLLWTSEAAAERITLLPFEGDSARALRWRVAQVLKRAGHVVLGYGPPRDPDSASELRRYAGRRRVDVFIAGVSEASRGAWELSLRLRGSDGSAMGGPLQFRARNLYGLIRELKGDGQGRLDRAVRGGAGVGDGPAAFASAEPSAPAEDPATWDADGEGPADSERSARSRRSRASKRSARSKRAEARAAAPRRSEASEAREDSGAVSAAALDMDLEDGAEQSVEMDADDPPSTAEEPDARPSQARARKSGLFARSAPREESEVEGSAEDVGSSALDATVSNSAMLDSEVQDGAEGRSEAQTGRPVPLVKIGVDAGVVRRALSYVDDIYGRLRAPTTNGWLYRVHASFQPFARPLKERLSLLASYESAFTGEVRDSRNDRDFSVRFSEFSGGLRFRQPLGEHELGVQATAGKLTSGLDDAERLAGVPEFSYTFLSPTADLHLHFGDVSLRGSAGYRRTLGDLGEVGTADWFPRVEGYGLEAQLGLEYLLSDDVAFDVSGSLRRFVLTMNARPEDAIGGVSEVAAGAVDQYLTGYFGLRILL